MALPHKSVATIDNIEFINLTPLDVNPLMSKCQIKVFYVGANRNGSYIKKEVAEEMAKTLRGAPIVGYYKQNKEDFGDHGQKVIIDDQGFHFEVQTKPYGFVSPDAQVWFQKFMEEDDFGTEVEREYLVTTGYLWTDQYPESKKIFQDNGKPQSMELDNNSLDGHWAKDPNSQIEFFIINDATISKLCILGNDVEPCFEGASITEPQLSKAFSKTDNNDFVKTLFSMMKDLEFALQGGNSVQDELKEANITEEKQLDNFSLENQDNNLEVFSAENQEITEDENDISSSSSDFAKEDLDDNQEEDPEEESDSEDEDLEDEDEDKTKNSLHTDEQYDALKMQYNELEAKYNDLVKENTDLVSFKNKVEDQQKDRLIEKFFMLTEEDKKDVLQNKRSYTLEQIEEKLAVICFRKKVNFDLEDSSNNTRQTEKDTTIFEYNYINDSTPEWVKQVEQTQKRL